MISEKFKHPTVKTKAVATQLLKSTDKSYLKNKSNLLQISWNLGFWKVGFGQEVKLGWVPPSTFYRCLFKISWIAYLIVLKFRIAMQHHLMKIFFKILVCWFLFPLKCFIIKQRINVISAKMLWHFQNNY